MLIKSPQLIFIFTLLSGTILACSSSSWVLAWVGLEVNLMSLIPLLIKNLTPLSMELTIKYFLVQAMASMIIIFSTLVYNVSSLISMSIETSYLFSIALAMKAGVAPLHFWFPQIMAYADWTQAFIILTWQKIAPLILLSFTYSILIPMFVVSSALIGMLGGLNQTLFKKILTYSSIIHSSWLILVSFTNDSVWWIYFISYSLMSISIIMPVNLIQVNSINEINFTKTNFINKLIIFINILSLAGLPPFLGFFIKLVSINSMIFSSINLMVIATLIISSLVAFYFYCRIMYSSLLLSETPSKMWNTTPHIENQLSKMLIISLTVNMMISFLVLLV